jgi:hypothetical protein
MAQGSVQSFGTDPITANSLYILLAIKAFTRVVKYTVIKSSLLI